MQIACCVYLHNCVQRTEPLFSDQYQDSGPDPVLFCAAEAGRLASLIESHIGGGNGESIVERIDREGLAPSRSLIERTHDLVRQQDVFTLLDDQISAMKTIVAALNRAVRKGEKAIILVEGGPGTGKSVIALDALGHALRQERATFLVSGSAAFTHGMRRLLGSEIASLVRFTDFFWEHEENSVDVLIVDEAHRIRAKSVPKVVAERRPRISQLEELVRAARVTVLFMDTNQIIEPDENGDPEQVIALARRVGAALVHHELRSQFRCDGSDRYLQWADALFEVRGAWSTQDLLSAEVFDFAVLDSPHAVLDWINDRNEQEPNSARLTAGWCWPWSDPRSDGTLVNDIVIGDFSFPWELKNGRKGAFGIPEAKHWAVDPNGAQQAGTVYSVQGFEFRHVGVLMGT